MTQADQELLLKDLSARLPYGVKAFAKTHKGNKIGKVITITTKFIDYSQGNAILGELYTDDECFWLDYGLFQPYLRPLSSMTEEEKELLKKEHVKDEKLYLGVINGDGSMRGKVILHYGADWCNKNHFDYRGLIENGLALEAPEGMYKTE